nr:helicase HerA-like domain-containing protein [Salsipaludibacter albus]
MGKAYGFEDPSVVFGRPLTADLEDTVDDVAVKVPLASLNKHGLIAGATGTGKTKSLQVMAEGLSAAGVPVFLADLKGDLTGLAIPSPGHPRIDERMDGMALPWAPESFPVEVLSISGEVGSPLRVPVSEFGPLLLAKVMDCSETQESVLQVLFKFADEQGLALVDLVDLVEVLKYLTSDAGRSVQASYGGMATSTLNVLLRKAMELETQGAEQFFGEPAFDVADLVRTRDGRGVVSVMNLTDMQDRPKIFSTFTMWLLAELYETSPEMGDPDQPVLAFFFDEAHLLFKDASSAMLDAVEMTVRMIRSKGIGVFFVTQNPTDLPESVLAQLGNRVQHALRAFTPNDKKALRDTADTFPETDVYDVRATLQGLGTGEALVTVLDPDGSPTATVATRMVAPRSTMDPITDEQAAEIAASGDLGDTYAEELDRESAREVLAERMAESVVPATEDDDAPAAEAPVESRDDAPTPEAPEAERDEPLLSTSGWKTVEDVAAAVTPHGHKGLVRRGVKVLRGFLGNRRR